MIESAERATGTAVREYHHGRTPAAWAGSIIAAVAFILGAVAFMVGPNWTLLWVSVGPARAFPRDRWRPAPDGIRTILK